MLDGMARAGLFDTGMVLVGTVAQQQYLAVLGCTLDMSAMMTQDADFVAATVNVNIVAPDGSEAVHADGTAAHAGDDGRDDHEDDDQHHQQDDMLAVLKRADPTFIAAPTLRRNAFPSRFTASNGLDVELLTPARHRKEEKPVDLPALKAGAIPLHYLEYLVEDAVPAVVLHGSGVRVTVPQPARYAVHKLIVAQLRTNENAKRGKDLAQAAALMAALDEIDPDALGDALDDARERGPKWRVHVQASLAAIGRE